MNLIKIKKMNWEENMKEIKITNQKVEIDRAEYEQLEWYKERYEQFCKGQHEKRIDMELRILENYINNMTKAYRKRNRNYMIVRDLLQEGTCRAGKSSCIKKCFELQIDPYSYVLYKKKRKDRRHDG